MWTERADEFFEGDRGGRRRDVHGGDDLPCIVADRRRDRMHLGSELFVVDGEAPSRICSSSWRSAVLLVIVFGVRLSRFPAASLCCA